MSVDAQQVAQADTITARLSLNVISMPITKNGHSDS